MNNYGHDGLPGSQSTAALSPGSGLLGRRKPVEAAKALDTEAHTHIHIYIYIPVHVEMYTYMYNCTIIQTCIHVQTCVYIYVYDVCI